MLIEIPLISKLTLYLGHPIYGFSGGVFALLISAGTGSLLGNKLKLFENKRYYLPLLAIGLLAAVNNLIFPRIISDTISGSLLLKVLISGVFIFPLGFFLGMPFPYVLDKCKNNRSDLSIPAIWAVNGLASVIGSIIAIIISISIGYSGVLWIGAALYGVLFFSFNPGTFFRRK
jgi:hypothetical protein